MSKKLPVEVRKANEAAQQKRWVLKNRPKVRANYKRWYYRHQTEYLEQTRKDYAMRTDSQIRSERNCHYRNSYGISVKDYDAMLARQNGVCAICGTNKAGKVGQHFAVDHCHKTGKFRGLLCINCNGRLGWYEQHQDGIDEYVDVHIGRRVQFMAATSPSKTGGGMFVPLTSDVKFTLVTM